MLKLQTPVEIERSKVGISLKDRILILGSCFADNMGKKMQEIGMDVCVNPFGTLYNPASILRSVERLADPVPFAMEECRKMGSGAELFCSFSHHTSFARRSEEEFLANANSMLESSSSFFRSCNKVIITLGTCRCYRHLEDGMIVSNCLKRNQAEFTGVTLSVEECVTSLEKMLSACTNGSAKEFIFTVSPIRHLKDGAHGNQLSKATLLLAADKICSEHENCSYFPSYEIVMDELRDYRFYAEDMTHPSQQTVNYIWERFCETVFPEKEKDCLKSLEKAARQSRHIQMH